MCKRLWSQFVAALLVVSVISVGTSPQSVHSSAQQDCRLFPETGKTVCDPFLTYWVTHGDLAQQGYAISERMEEKSLTDGKTYTVQYFERAVFEQHPELQPPNNVLLSLLGVFRYREKYPQGAPDQKPNTDVGSRLFAETGKRLGGLFLKYWNEHGGLAQQGLPISEEFMEKSDLDGKTYLVQYFERAVFEHHPENKPPYDVLLTQLGTLQYQKRYSQSTPPTPATPAPPPGAPSPGPEPTAVPPTPPPPPSLTGCDGIPPSEYVLVEPNCAPLYTRFTIRNRGGVFKDDDVFDIQAITPSGEEFGVLHSVPVGRPVYLTIDDETPFYGVWKLRLVGTKTHKEVYGYLKVLPRTPDSEGP